MAKRVEGQPGTVAVPGYERKKKSSRQLPKDLPWVEQVYELNEAQRQCDCGHGGVTTAPKPKAPLPGSQASPQLIAHVMSAKYHDGLPLYRQEKMAKREGLDLPRAKLARWVIDGSKVLQPGWNLLEDTLFSCNITAADETASKFSKSLIENLTTKAGCGCAEGALLINRWSWWITHHHEPVEWPATYLNRAKAI